MGAPGVGSELHWRVVLDGPTPGATNMARDHALAATLPEDGAVLRFYGWARPTLSLGRHEPARERWDPEALGREGVDVVRRPTGGRAVLHHRELTYSVVLPLTSRPGLRELYRSINRALVRGLVALGVPARVVGDEGRVEGVDHGPCFTGPAPGEVEAGGRKLVGSAQARVEGRLLQHGSLLLHDDQSRLEAMARPGAPRASGPVVSPATLGAFLDPLPDQERLVEALVGGFQAVLPGRWPRDWPGGPWEDTFTAETRAAEDRFLERYASPAWTWRR